MVRDSSPLWIATFVLVAFGLAPGIVHAFGYGSDTRAYNIAHGRVVFMNSCMDCHERGRRGAPMVGEIDDWRERLDQPLDTLISHAVNGHGDMPARGDLDISDQDVAAAVAFIVDRTRTLIGPDENDLESLPPTASGGSSSDDASRPPDSAVVRMFMILLGKDRWR